jgi:hypothetical protein
MNKLKMISNRYPYIFFLLLFTGNSLFAQLEPLDIKLPQPMFVGTPTNFKVTNLEKPREVARPPFFAPPGTYNAALGKNVYSNYEPRIGELWRVTDGDKEATSYSYVELGQGHQYITIDLEELYTIYAITIWHYHMSARVYLGVAVQVSSDPDFIMDVVTIFNNDMDNSLGLGVGTDYHYVETHEGKLIDAKGFEGQYIRLHSMGNTDNDLNHYIEVEVYGKPAF